MTTKRVCIIAFKQVQQCIHVLRQIEYLSAHYALDVIGYGEPNAGWPALQWHSVPEPGLFGKVAKCFWFAAGKVCPRLYYAWFWSQTRHTNALRYALASDADAFHANDWQSLPIAIEAARRLHARVVFHMHEYAEEERSDSRAWRLLVAPAIRYLIKRYTSQADCTVDAFITVCQPIAERYSRELGVNVEIVFNAPKPVSPRERQVMLTDPEHVRLVHHGYAKRGRGLHKLVEALALADRRFTLEFMLVADDRGYIDELRTLANRLAPGRVSFHEPVPPGEIVSRIADCDIGFCVIEPSTYNNLMMLPNKFFEYIQAGLAVCVGPSPAMMKLVEQHGVGVAAASFDPAEVAVTLNRLTWAEISRMKRAARAAAAVLNADVEMEKVVALYRRLPGRASVVVSS